MLGAVAQDVQGFGFLRENFRQQLANDGVGIELVERGILFDGRWRQTGIGVLLQGQAGGVLLASQVAADAAVELHAQVEQVLAEDLRLAHARSGQHVVVVCTEGGLAMSNQVNTAHARYCPGR